MFDEQFSTRETAKILGLPVANVSKMIWDGRLNPPPKDSGGRYKWSRLDVHKAAWQTSRQKSFEAWEAENPPPRQPGESAAKPPVPAPVRESRLTILVGGSHE